MPRGASGGWFLQAFPQCTSPDREVRGMMGMGLLEWFVLGAVCIGFPLIGAGAVVAIAMPLRPANQTKA